MSLSAPGTAVGLVVALSMAMALPVAGAAAGCDSSQMELASSTGWSGYLGPDRNGRVASGGLFQAGRDLRLETAWRRPLGSGYSGIAVVAGRVVTMFSDGLFDVVAAFDQDSGEEIWRYRVAETLRGYSGSADGPLSTPALGQERVFALGPKGRLVALTAAGGELLWETNLVGTFAAALPSWGMTTSPLLVGDTLFVQVGKAGGKTICSFAAEDGAVRWCRGDTAVGYQSPTLVSLLGRRQIVAVSDTHLLSVDPRQGNELWHLEYEPGGGEGGSQAVAIGLDRILIESSRGFVLYELTDWRNEVLIKELWHSRKLRDSFDIPVYHDGYLYGYSGSLLTCVDARSGESVWQSRAPGEGEAILIDDHLVTWGNDGRLRVILASADGYREVASEKVLRRGSYTAPSYFDGRLYVRNLSEIAAVRVLPSSPPSSPTTTAR